VAQIVEIRHLTPEKLDVFKDLLGSKDFGGCFCAVWTSYSDDWVRRCKDQTQPNFLITKRNVEEGRHVGVLVYRGTDLVGWTGSGPKTDFPFLKTKLGSRLSIFSSEIWSVGCLAIADSYRGNGLADFIIQAVAEEARAKGATHLEAYPTRPIQRSDYPAEKRLRRFI
jgi:GNAT superfamily N-acetyltransferase